MKNKEKTTTVTTSSEVITKPEAKKRTIDEKRLPPKLIGVEGNDEAINRVIKIIFFIFLV